MPGERDSFGVGELALLAPEVASGAESLPAERCLEIHRLMVRTRVMEERMIKMSKSGQGFFWIGGPGEEGVVEYGAHAVDGQAHAHQRAGHDARSRQELARGWLGHVAPGVKGQELRGAEFRQEAIEPGLDD